MAAPPTGTVTFLFTDVEGSTKRAQADAVAWSAAQARHHEIVRQAIESNDGFVFRTVVQAMEREQSRLDSAMLEAALEDGRTLTFEQAVELATAE